MFDMPDIPQKNKLMIINVENVKIHKKIVIIILEFITDVEKW